MAKSRSKKLRTVNRTRQRVNPYNARPLLPKIIIKPISPPKPLYQVEDRRRFKPALVSPLRTAQAKVAKITPKFPFGIRGPVVFELPRQAVVCLRRKMRRQVLFAKRKTRRGAGSKRRHNETSRYKCKR